MGASKNHHFVPKYHFRRYTCRKDYIGALLIDDGRIIEKASITGQCSKSNFSGHAEIEKALGVAETRHSLAINEFVANARSLVRPWPDNVRFSVIQAIAFQEARTELSALRNKQATEKMAALYLEASIRSDKDHDEEFKNRLINYLRDGTAKITQSVSSLSLLQISTMDDMWLNLIDLRLCLLDNKSKYPFIFSDSPAILHNKQHEQVVSRGVLGYQSPGLQIFMPITPTKALMLFDASAYRGGIWENDCLTLRARKDVDELNALQLHNAHKCIYFDSDDAAAVKYSQRLYAAHKHLLIKNVNMFEKVDGAYIDGVPCKDELYMFKGRSMIKKLSSSFCKCTPVTDEEFNPSQRSPELAKIVDQIVSEKDGDKKTGQVRF